MKVKAKFPEGKFGFYGTQRRYNGNEFVLTSPDDFSAKWMVSLEEEEVVKPKRTRKPKAFEVEAVVVEAEGE